MLCSATLALAGHGCDEPPPCGTEGAAACPVEASLTAGTICADTNTAPGCVDDQGYAPLHLEDPTVPVDLVVHMGPQGGFHVFLSVRAWGIDPGDPDTAKGDLGNPLVTFTVKDGDVLLGRRELRVGLLEGPDGSFERVGVAVVLEEDLVQTPQNIDGRPLTVEIDVTDAMGVTTSDLVNVIAVGIVG